MKWLTHIVLPIVLAGLLITATFALSRLFAPREPGAMDMQAFGKIVVVDQGRTKPLDTLARTTLLILKERGGGWKDAQGKRHPPITFLADLMTGSLGDTTVSPKCDSHPVFRIENQQLLVVLDLPERPGLRYSVNEMRPRLGELSQQVMRAQSVEPDTRSPFQQAVMELAVKLNLYTAIMQWQTPLAVPPSDDKPWRSLFEAAHAGQMGGQADEGVRSFADVLNAYAQGDATAFNKATAQHLERLKYEQPAVERRAQTEWHFNQINLFGKSSILYLLAFVIGCLSWLWTGLNKPLGRAALLMVVFSLAIHTVGLLVRMYLQQRPFVFVTNLYSSALFIGWGCAVLGLILEAIQRRAIGTVLAAVAGSRRIAYVLSLDGDTLEMMRAVLDTNFWLATHVTTITFGYSATFMAGLLGAVFVLMGMFTPWMDARARRVFGLMIYGTVCFALLLSFVGTVLGGIWADQSWGRFWGWDPKENGALLLVLWNALILHARWGRMVGDRGVAVLAIFGNIVTAWSWFGVNMLGAGLHAYGFMDGAWFWLLFFAGINLSVMFIGMLPQQMWFSVIAEEGAPRHGV